MVAPLCPPMTGTLNPFGSTSLPRAWAIKVEALTTSSVVTPKRRVGSNAPCVRSASAATGTVEFTGLVTIQQVALGHVLATSMKRSRIMPALVC